MIPIIDLFTSIQGEGKYSGVPSIFIRVSGCNLRCMFKGSICDTPYSSFTPEKGNYSMEDIKKVIEENKHINHLVITGGEPLMYGSKLESFLEEIYEDRMVVTIETNGTKPILNPFNQKAKVALYSVSPKLSNSQPAIEDVLGMFDIDEKTATNICKKHSEERINIKNLYEIILRSTDYQMKFVYSGEEAVEEIKELYNKIGAYAEQKSIHDYNFYQFNHPKYHTMLMPEGTTNEILNRSRREAADICVKENWHYSDRLHIVVYGDKRGF